MRRVTLKLTEAQAAWLRGAVRSHAEDMGLSGMHSVTEERMANDILNQLLRPAKEEKKDEFK